MKGRVLLIDDEAEIRRNLSVGLMQEDYDVVACPDGISAIHELDNARGRGETFERIGGSSCLLASQPSDPGADAPPCVPSISC